MTEQTNQDPPIRTMTLEETRAFMQKLAKGIDTILNVELRGPTKVGFVLLTFPLNAPPSETNVNYVSNASRDGMQLALEGVVARWQKRDPHAPTQ